MKAIDPTSTPSTRKIIAIASAVIALCCVGILCYSAALFYVVDKDISLIPTPTIDLACADTTCLNACIRQLPDFVIAPLANNREELAKKQDGYELARYRLNEQTRQLENVSQLTVPEYLKPYQTDTQLHYRIWAYLTGIFPNSAELHFSYMVVYADASKNGSAASVGNLDGKWRIYVNLLDFDSPEAVVDILTHEYGHMLTLNKTQIQNIPDEYGSQRKQEEFDKMRAMCADRFFTGYECATGASYLNTYGNRFWTGEVYEAWTKVFLLINQDGDTYRAAINEFYAEYSDKFVSAYAATNPHEDMAESWTEFILRPKPTGTSIANQKVLFFYGYPELVQMRSDIIQGICQSAVDHK
jgi:hypothetical protein